MERRYHNLTQWNQWLANTSGGHCLLKEESRVLSKMIPDSVFNKHATLIGVPAQQSMLQTSLGLHQFMISALFASGKRSYIQADYQELPIISGQIDLVILPHTLEWVERPRQLLAEACRIVKPEGLILVFGFNPHSLFKLTQWYEKKRGIPWSADFLPVHELKRWMELAGFQIEAVSSFLYRPLIKYAYFFDRFPVFEWVGEHIFPYYGGVYAVLARAKEIPLTPIRMQWKQHLGDSIRISSAISRHTIHDGVK